MDRGNFKHAIMISYADLASNVLPDFVAKQKAKHGDNFHQLWFDRGEKESQLMRHIVERIPANDGLKVFICGHGNIGIEFVTDDSESRKQTLDDIARFLIYGLGSRCIAKDQAAKTRINMIACRFGRTPDGTADKIPAVMLHQKLFKRGLYVEVEARTESIITFRKKGEPETPRRTMGISQEKKEESEGKAYSYTPRRQYTKLLCTCVQGNAIAQFKSYDAQHADILVNDLVGRRFLWGENVVNEVTKYLNFSHGNIVGDGREKTLWQIIKWFENGRDPEALKERFEKVLSGEGVGLTDNDFTKHRNPVSAMFAWSEPKTAQLVRSLLQKYPR